MLTVCHYGNYASPISFVLRLITDDMMKHCFELCKYM